MSAEVVFSPGGLMAVRNGEPVLIETATGMPVTVRLAGADVADPVQGALLLVTPHALAIVASEPEGQVVAGNDGLDYRVRMDGAQP